MEFTFGTDPEFLLARDGKYVSAIGVVAGNTDNRIKVSGHEFYYDNVLAECAVKPGATRAEAVANVRECLRIYARIVRPHRLAPRASHTYPDDQLRHKHAREVGCNKEWCAYTLRIIPPPKKLMAQSGFRTAGAHVHLGGGGPLRNAWEKPFVVYMLDLFLALPSVFLDKDESSPARRRMYGQAGSHRDKPYGLEYRALGPFWLGSPARVELVWDICDFVLSFVAGGGHKKFWSVNESLLDGEDPSLAYHCHGYDSGLLRETINTSDKGHAEQFMQFIRKYLPGNVAQDIRAHDARPEPDFYKEWGLD